MQARTYHESQDKPTYVIREIRQSEPARSPEFLPRPASRAPQAWRETTKPVSISSGSTEPRGEATGGLGKIPGAADARITDIQREFGAEPFAAQRYADLVVGQPGLWALVKYEARAAAVGLGAGRARSVPAFEALSVDSGSRGQERRLRLQCRAAASRTRSTSTTTSSSTTSAVWTRRGPTNRRHLDQARRVHRPQHDPELQERRHRPRRRRQHRLQRRGVLGRDGPGRQEGADRRLHVSRRRRSSATIAWTCRCSTRGGRRAASTSATTSGSAPTSS